MSTILAVNPGSTSTKIAVYHNEDELFTVSITHKDEELSAFPTLISQLGYRKNVIQLTLQEQGFDISSLSAVVGRGGILPPVKAGGYLVNEEMKNYLIYHPVMVHASNLGAIIADEIAKPLGIPAYIYDAVSSDEFTEIAKITGFPEITRQSFCHVLNSKAMSRKVAEKYGKRYEEMKFIVAHLGGGISISAHVNGKIIDSESDDAGPFAPERSGCVPLLYLVDMCYSGKYDKNQMLKKIRGSGGLKALLGTTDCEKIEKMIENGDEYAKLIYEAFAYQIAKGIGMMIVVPQGKIDAIILTGGIAFSEKLTDMIRGYVEAFAPVEVMPGENEMESLALGALRILKKEEIVNEYVSSQV